MKKAENREEGIIKTLNSSTKDKLCKILDVKGNQSKLKGKN